MMSELQTDEYRISISREITVCRNMIERQKKYLTRFEQRYGLSTEEMKMTERLKNESGVEDIEEWHNEYEGLLAWQQRLREYEEAYEGLRR